MENVHFVRHQRIIVKNVQIVKHVRNVQQDIIQLMEFALNVVNKAVQIHVMYQQEYVQHVIQDII